MPYTPLQLADAFVQAGELDDALDALNDHLAATPTDADARRLRASILARRDALTGFEQALADLHALPEHTAEDAVLAVRLVEQISGLQAALEQAEEAHGRFPQDDRVTELLLTLLRRADATARGREIVAKLGDDWRWQVWAGDFAADAGDNAAAITAYTAALDALGAAQVVMPSHLLTKLDIKAAAIAGSVARLLTARAACYVQLGVYAPAQADYTAAAKLLLDDPTLPLNMGIIAWRQGDTISAQAHVCDAFALASPAMAAHLNAMLADAGAIHLRPKE
jgi:tetratricopeptide (TPR) repeat protein